MILRRIHGFKLLLRICSVKAYLSGSPNFPALKDIGETKDGKEAQNTFAKACENYNNAITDNCFLFSLN